MCPTRSRRLVASEAPAIAAPRSAREAPSNRPRRRTAMTPAEHLANDLRATERSLHEAAAGFTERVAAQLARVGAAVGATPPPKRAVIEALAARLAEIKLKPARGRLKDLARLKKLAEELAELLPDA